MVPRCRELLTTSWVENGSWQVLPPPQAFSAGAVLGSILHECMRTTFAYNLYTVSRLVEMPAREQRD